jgi:hypothetical protein
VPFLSAGLLWHLVQTRFCTEVFGRMGQRALSKANALQPVRLKEDGRDFISSTNHCTENAGVRILRARRSLSCRMLAPNKEEPTITGL